MGRKVWFCTVEYHGDSTNKIATITYQRSISSYNGWLCEFRSVCPHFGTWPEGQRLGQICSECQKNNGYFPLFDLYEDLTGPCVEIVPKLVDALRLLDRNFQVRPHAKDKITDKINLSQKQPPDFRSEWAKKLVNLLQGLDIKLLPTTYIQDHGRHVTTDDLRKNKLLHFTSFADVLMDLLLEGVDVMTDHQSCFVVEDATKILYNGESYTITNVL